MNEERTQEILLEIVKEISGIRIQVATLEEIKIELRESNKKVGRLEMITERQERQIEVVETRCREMEKFTRDNVLDSKKTQSNIFISMGLAIFSSILTLIFNLLK